MKRVHIISPMLLVMLALAACSQPLTNTMHPSTGSPDQGGKEKISIDHVTVSEVQIVVLGTSTLPDGDCVYTKLFAGEAPLSWWPTDACGQVQQREWELIVPLDGHKIDSSVDYVIKAYLEGSDEIAATLAFDTAAPPQP